MTPSHFAHWLEGYLEAKPYHSDAIKTIQEKLKTVKHNTPYYYTLPYYPVTYGSNTMDCTTITCENKPVSLNVSNVSSV